MATSYLRETVEKLASDKELKIVGSMDTAMRSADKKLDRGEIDPAEAMKMLKSAFGTKFSGGDYRNIEKEINYRLRK